MHSEGTGTGTGTDADADADAAFAGYFGTARHALLALLPADGAPSQVLEVDCSSGANLAALKLRFPGCSTTGVELATRASHAARQRQGVDTIVQGDVHSIDLPDAGFDLIVLSHVLEHFAEPAAALQRVPRRLTPTGKLLVALPNQS